MESFCNYNDNNAAIVKRRMALIFDEKYYKTHQVLETHF